MVLYFQTNDSSSVVSFRTSCGLYKKFCLVCRWELGGRFLCHQNDRSSRTSVSGEWERSLTGPDPAVYTFILSLKCRRTERMQFVLVPCFLVSVEWNFYWALVKHLLSYLLPISISDKRSTSVKALLLVYIQKKTVQNEVLICFTAKFLIWNTQDTFPFLPQLRFSGVLVKWQRFFAFLAAQQRTDGIQLLEQRLELKQTQVKGFIVPLILAIISVL